MKEEMQDHGGRPMENWRDFWIGTFLAVLTLLTIMSIVLSIMFIVKSGIL